MTHTIRELQAQYVTNEEGKKTARLIEKRQKVKTKNKFEYLKD